MKYRDCVILFNSRPLKNPMRHEMLILPIDEQTSFTDQIFLSSIGGVFLEAQKADFPETVELIKKDFQYLANDLNFPILQLIREFTKIDEFDTAFIQRHGGKA